MKQPNSVKDIAGNPGQPLASIQPPNQIPLPPPFDDVDLDPPIRKHRRKKRDLWRPS